jgi:hypothetical protein
MATRPVTPDRPAQPPRQTNMVRRRYAARFNAHELLLLLLYRNLPTDAARQLVDRVVWEAWTHKRPEADYRATNRRFGRELRALKAGHLRTDAFDRFCAPWMPPDVPPLAVRVKDKVTAFLRDGSEDGASAMAPGGAR